MLKNFRLNIKILKGSSRYFTIPGTLLGNLNDLRLLSWYGLIEKIELMRKRIDGAWLNLTYHLTY